jgi:hypothetical protein
VPAGDVSVRDDGTAMPASALSGPTVELALRPLPGGGAATDPFYLRVTNRAGRRLYTALVDLTPSFGASVALLPPAPLEPGGLLVNEGRAVRFGVGGRVGPFVDRLRLVVSDQPILAEPLVLQPLAEMLSAPVGGETPGAGGSRGRDSAGSAVSSPPDRERFVATRRDGAAPEWAVVAVDVIARPG